MRLIQFEDFTRYATFFYKTIGIRPYSKPWQLGSNKIPLLEYFIFYVGIVNLNLNTLCEALFVVVSFVNGDDFVNATISLTYVGFDIVCSSKMLFIWLKRPKLDQLVHELHEMLPKNCADQAKYKADIYLQQCTKVTFAFSLLYMILIWTYNLFAYVQWLLYDYLLRMRAIEQILPYTMYIPWDYRDHWTYYMLYAMQSAAGYTAAAGQIASDLLLCSFATQVIMHYDHVGRSLDAYDLKANEHISRDLKRRQQQHDDDLDFIKRLIAYHDKVLSLSDLMNDVFGIPLLINLMTSCFVICFVGFQLTIGIAAWDEKFELLLFLLSSIGQVYLICHHGQLLIEASTDIARAVYEHNWSNADVRYRKMLIIIMGRAQKPAMLKATKFVNVNREKFSELMHTSYSFFTILQAMYGDPSKSA